MTAEALSLEEVRFTYRGSDRPALDGLTLSAAEGESLWLLGASGSGRSTVALTTNRVVPLHHRGSFSGRVRLFGKPLDGLSVADLAGTVGQVFQDFDSQIFATRVDLETAFGCENLGVPLAEMRRRVAETLQQVGLGGFERRDPATLSGGEKQRLVLASVLAMQPRLLVLDEPTTDLDPIGRGAVWELLRELKGQGRTLLLVEPETEEGDLGDRVVVLERGKIAEDAPPADVFSRVSRLERLGVHPPDLAAVAERLGLAGRPATVESMAVEIRGMGLSLDPATVLDILDGDRARRSAGEEVLRLEGVGHSYPGEETPALAGADLTFREGEFVAILGANGSGKTTLAQAACGLLAPSQGGVFLEGREIGQIPARDRGRRIGFVFQNPDQQLFASTVLEEVCFAPRNFGMDEAAVRRSAGEALESVGLLGVESRDPFMMTRGDRQRVAVASVIAAGPRILVLDEPTTGLDPRGQRGMMGLLGRLREAGRTIVIVTHSIGLAGRWAERLVVLHAARVVADGPAREVLASRSLPRDSAIRPPRIVELAARLGAPLVCVDEVVRALGAGRLDGRTGGGGAL